MSRNARSGFTELQGFAWPKENRYARTLRNKSAVYYSLYVEEFQYRFHRGAVEVLMNGGGRDSAHGQWVRTYSYHHHHAFYVLDPTGLVEVDPNAYTEMIKTERSNLPFNSLSVEEQSRLREMAPAVFGGAMLAPTNSAHGSLSVSSSQRITEEEILVGAPILTSGHFVSCAQEGRTVTERELTEFAVKKFDPLRLVYKDPTALISFPVFGTLADTDEEKVFIANHHERNLLGRLKKQDWISFAAALALFVLGFI